MNAPPPLSNPGISMMKDAKINFQIFLLTGLINPTNDPRPSIIPLNHFVPNGDFSMNIIGAAFLGFLLVSYLASGAGHIDTREILNGIVLDSFFYIEVNASF